MLEWILAKLTSGVAKSVLGIFGDTIVKPFLQAYMKGKDVDLSKFQSSEITTEHIAMAVLDANVKFAEIKSNYALAVLQWWPFRLLLFILISVCTVRFSLAMFDSTWWWIHGCMMPDIHGKLAHVTGDVCSWSFPEVKGRYGGAERDLLAFFILAKPVDTAVGGALNLASKYLNKK